MQASTYQAIYEHEQAHWWYRVRRELVADLLERLTPKREKLRILDVGCGTGLLLQELAKYGEVAGVDMSPEAVQYCASRGISTVERGDITQLPFETNSFDVVLALDVVEHVHDDVQAVSELRRVVRVDGTIIVFVPAMGILWGKTDEVGHHYRRYTRAQLRQILRESGLHVKRISYFNTFLFLPILFFRLVARYTGIEFFDEYRPGIGSLNELLYKVFRFETKVMRKLSFPVGVSIMAVCSPVNVDTDVHS